MTTTIGNLKDTTVDATDAPGQTSVNYFGEGGNQSSDDGREVVQDREVYGEWWAVHRHPANGTFESDDETELVITRLGPDDTIVTGSKNREVEAAVRTALSRDLVPGELVFYTGDGTGYAYIDIEPDGPVTHYTSDGTNSVSIYLDPANEKIDLVVDGTGEVRIGGAAATDYITLFDGLKTQWDANVTDFNTHTHNYLPGPGAATPTTTPTPVQANLTTTNTRSSRGRAI